MSDRFHKVSLTRSFCEELLQAQKKNALCGIALICALFSGLCIAIWFFYRKPVNVVILAAVGGSMLFKACLSLRCLLRARFYLMLDRVERFKTGYADGYKTSTRNKVFTYIFCKGGKYRIKKSAALLQFTLRTRNEVDPDEDALEHFAEHAQFYLLVAEAKGKRKILQIFSTVSFEFPKGEFEERDGTYPLTN